MKPFKKSTRLLANIQVPSLFKCNPSFHKHSLVMLSLLMKWNLLLLHSSRKWSLTCLMILANLNCLLINIGEIITSFTPYSKHFFPMSKIHFEMPFESILLIKLCVISFEPTWIITMSGRSSSRTGVMKLVYDPVVHEFQFGLLRNY